MTLDRSSPLVRKFAERDNSGKIDAVLNDGLSAAQGGPSHLRTTIGVYPGFLSQAYRYMFQKLSEKGASK